MNFTANNGDVEILFYEEQEVLEVRLNSTWNPTYVNNNLTTPIGNNFYTTSVNYSSDVSSFNINLNDTLSFSNNPRSNKFEQRPRSRSFTKKTKSIETGRVEQGFIK